MSLKKTLKPFGWHVLSVLCGALPSTDFHGIKRRIPFGNYRFLLCPSEGISSSDDELSIKHFNEPNLFYCFENFRGRSPRYYSSNPRTSFSRCFDVGLHHRPSSIRSSDCFSLNLALLLLPLGSMLLQSFL